MNKYSPKDIEKKWQQYWTDNETYKVEDNTDAPKQYVLDMFPYPSGAGLHVGHPKGFIATDIYSRFKRMQGFNVLHPMGWDAFGLPAENYAIKHKVQPRVAVEKNVAVFKSQLEKIGFNFDWGREVNTTDPEFYKWTQWCIAKMFEAGLMEEVHEPIIWCPECKTGLALEDLEDGKCERCGSVIEKKMLRQWVIKITKYADRLLEGLEDLEWEEGIKVSQRNWIGRSEGATVNFNVIANNSTTLSVNSTKQSRGDEEDEIAASPSASRNDSDNILEVFTTRPDTLFGATFMVIAPEHPLVHDLEGQIENLDEVKAYVTAAAGKTDLDREVAKEKTGVKLEGISAINPVNNTEIPIYIADYVMMGYGTGAIMAVPAHDERDFAFAKKYGIDVQEVVVTPLTLTEEQKETVRVYEEGIEDYIKKTPTESEGEHKVWIDAFIDIVGTGATVLELGAGTGRDYKTMMEAGLVVSATDIAESFVSYLNDTVVTDNSAKMLDMYTESLGIEQYDACFANAVLIHATQAQFPVLVGRIHRAIKPNGTFAISLKKGTGEHSDTWLMPGDRFYKYWTQEELKSIFDTVGFDVSYSNEYTTGRNTWLVYILKKVRTTEIVSAYGVAINSEFLNGKPTAEAKDAMIAWLEENGKGTRKVNYKLRDWVFARQRYWGEPFPFIHKEDGTVTVVPTEELPVTLPDVTHYEPTGTGESPLAGIDDWVNVDGGKRETNTMPQWAGSSWYYLRYIDPRNNDALVDAEKEKYWMGDKGVDMYVGGAEHATRHLIYARFWHKFLYDQGVVSTKEPFNKLINVGLILAEDGRKMSKRWGNVINPDDVIEQYGADSFRLYEMFMGPFTQSAAWNTRGVEGVYKFLARYSRLYEKEIVDTEIESQERLVNKAIKKVTNNIADFSFNTSISEMMIVVNELTKSDTVQRSVLERLNRILAPFAVHLTEELHHSVFAGEGSVHHAPWPSYDESKMVEDTVTIVVQINGKVRDQLSLAADISKEDAEAAALASEKVQGWLEGKEPKKVIYVPGKLVSIVV